jgi:ABC-type nitrate/sulfonate/bicarbonate transport system substrate-binding protein
LKKTGITRIEDLVGKTVAVPGLGAPPELFVRKAADMSGISPDSIKLVQQNLATIPPAIATDQVDAGMLFEPLLTGFMKKQKGVVILTRGVDIPVVNYGPTAYFVLDDSIKKENELIYKIFLSLAKAQWYIRTTGPDSDEILSIVSKATNMPAAIFKPSANKNVWDPRLKPIQVDNIKEEMKFFVNIAKLDGMVDVSEAWYSGFYERARIEHPELFSDLDNYLQGLKENGIVKDDDFITDFNE